MSKIEVNTVDVQCGSTLTLGSSGKTVTLATGASQTGFGRTGTVDWCTTVKTSPLTAVSGNGYFVNTCGGAVTVTLPSSPSAGDIVSLADYKSTWAVACKAVTLGRGGSKINGETECATLQTKGQSITMVYIDGTQGWKSVQDSTSDVTGAGYICASGGNATLTVGDYKSHIFTADGTFTVNNIGQPTVNTLEYLVVAGGGAGSFGRAGGGGAGGFRLYTTAPGCNSPLKAPAGLTASATGYPITVGSGGTGTCAPACPAFGGKGNPAVFSTITSAGGGGGHANEAFCAPKVDGGSGGGASFRGGGSPGGVGTGNTPPVSPPQGQNGGETTATGSPTPGPQRAGGAGGGAGGVGGSSAPGGAGKGGLGAYIADPFIGPTAPSYGTAGPVSSTRYFAGGGGAGMQDGAGGAAPDGGGGTAGNGTGASSAGTANTGGASGGSGEVGGSDTGNGGSGVVMIRYKFQN